MTARPQNIVSAWTVLEVLFLSTFKSDPDLGGTSNSQVSHWTKVWIDMVGRAESKWCLEAGKMVLQWLPQHMVANILAYLGKSGAAASKVVLR